jgi:hypothetical protein
MRYLSRNTRRHIGITFPHELRHQLTENISYKGAKIRNHKSELNRYVSFEGSKDAYLDAVSFLEIVRLMIGS